MSDLLFSANIVLPLFLLIALGHLLTRFKLWDGAFLKTANSVCFKVFFSVLLFYNITHSDFDKAFDLKLILYILGLTTVVIAVSMIIVPLVTRRNDQRGVLIQALFRSNYLLLGVPLCQAIYGESGAAMAAVFAVFIVPYLNVMGTVILSLYRTGKIEKPFRVLLGILKNPLIIGSMCGVVVLLAGIKLPTFIDKTLYDIKTVATPLALLILGGDFEIRSLRRNLSQVLTVSTIRLIVIPLIVFALSIALGYRGVELSVLLAMFGTPTAVSGYVMVCEMGGDRDLAGQIVVLTTLASVFTIFLSIFLLRLFGFLPAIPGN